MKWQSTAFVLLIGAVTAIAQRTPAPKNPPELSDGNSTLLGCAPGASNTG